MMSTASTCERCRLSCLRPCRPPLLLLRFQLRLLRLCCLLALAISFSGPLLAPRARRVQNHMHTADWCASMSLRSVIRPKAVDWMVAEPYVENCEPKAVCGAKPVVILDIDCKTATADMVEHVDTDFAMTMESCAQQTAAGAVPVYGFCSWFDVMFTGPAGLAGKTVRSPFSSAVVKLQRRRLFVL